MLLRIVSSPPASPSLDARHRQVVQAQRGEVRPVGLEREPVRAFQRGHRLLRLVGQGEDRAEIQRRVGERGRAGADREEQRHRPLRARLGLVRLADHEQQAREPHEAVRERRRVLVERLRRAPGGHRLAEPAGVVELPRVVVEQVSALGALEAVDVGHHRLEVRQRRAVRARPRGLARRRRPLGHQRVDVARLGRVMQQPRAGEQPGAHDVLVEQPPPDAEDALLDRAAGELMAEADPARSRFHQAGELGLGQRLEVGHQRQRERVGDHRRHDRQPLDRVAALRRSPAAAGPAPRPSRSPAPRRARPPAPRR